MKVRWLLFVVVLSACQADGTPRVEERFDDIAPDETLRFAGTEPFWGGEVTGMRLVYTTPENPEGAEIAVDRFAGNGGLGFSGTLSGQPFDMMVAKARCADGMSDRTYPFTVTIVIGDDPPRDGCGWTERQPHSGGAA